MEAVVNYAFIIQYSFFSLIWWLNKYVLSVFYVLIYQLANDGGKSNDFYGIFLPIWWAPLYRPFLLSNFCLQEGADSLALVIYVWEMSAFELCHSNTISGDHLEVYEIHWVMELYLKNIL